MLGVQSPHSRTTHVTPQKLLKKACKRTAQVPYELKLKILAAAFNACADPSNAELRTLGRRVGMSAAQLKVWYERRRVLESWVQRQPDVRAIEMAATLIRLGSPSTR